MEEPSTEIILPPRPLRPGYGEGRRKINLLTNWYKLDVRTEKLFQYNVSIEKIIPPEAADRPPRRPRRQEGPSIVPVIICRTALAQLSRELGWASGTWAFDGRANLYAVSDKLSVEKQLSFTLEGERRTTNVKVVLTCVADLSYPTRVLDEHFRSKTGPPDFPQHYIQALDVILRHHKGMESLTSDRVLSQGSAFLIEDSSKIFLGDGAEAWKGYRQSVRLCQNGLALNIDMAITAVYAAQHRDNSPVRLSDLMYEIRRQFREHQEREIMSAWRKKVKGLKIRTMHNGFKRTVQGFTNTPPHREEFSIEEEGKPPRTTNVAEYFRDRYNIEIKCRDLPCVKVGNIVLPPEVCQVLPKQKAVISDQTAAALIKGAQTRPDERARYLNNIVGAIDRDAQAENKKDAFNITLEKKMMQVEGYVLPPATLEYGRNQECTPQQGGWNLRDVKFFKCIEITSWAFISFNFRDPSMRSEEVFLDRYFVSGLNKLGIVTPRSRPRWVKGDDRRVEDSMKKAYNTARDKYGRSPQIIVVVLPTSATPLYRAVKHAGDSSLGIITQCLLYQNIRKDKGVEMYCANVALKVNAKLNGTNATMPRSIVSRFPSFLQSYDTAPFMVLGADVTHPVIGSFAPSVAAIVGSMDANLSRFATRISSQVHKKEGKSVQEIILDMEGMIESLLKEFSSVNKGKLPLSLIMYRDGVSEGQFNQVIQSEYMSIRRACTTFGGPKYEPKITFVVVQKRHQTRLFPANRSDGDKNGNVQPGTVIDRGITHPLEHDFYLNSHAGLLGTNRPAHYHVLIDENGFTANELHTFTYWSTYTFARCTRCISVPPAARYAHLAAFRGRHLLTGDDETGSVASGGSVELRLSPVHSKIANMMFYV